MNSNSGDRPPDSPGDGKLSDAISKAETLYERLAQMGYLAFFAIALVPVIAVLLYAVFVTSGEKNLIEANRRMDAAISVHKNGEKDEALKIVRGIGNDFPTLDIARFVRYYEGSFLFGLEKDKESLEIMESLLSESFDEMFRPDALFMAGVSSFRLEDPEKAIGYFEELISSGTSYEKRVLPLLGAAYMKTRNSEKAEALYMKFAAKFPEAGSDISQSGNSAQ